MDDDFNTDTTAAEKERSKNSWVKPGDKFGKLCVRKITRDKNYNRTAVCICECGCEKIVRVSDLVRGHVKSCGCLGPHPSDLVEGTRISSLTRGLQKNNTSGHKGVKFDGSRWIATIRFKGKHYHLGSYYNIGEAIEARRLAEEQLHKPAIDEYKKRTHDE